MGTLLGGLVPKSTRHKCGNHLQGRRTILCDPLVADRAIFTQDALPLRRRRGPILAATISIITASTGSAYSLVIFTSTPPMVPVAVPLCLCISFALRLVMTAITCQRPSLSSSPRLRPNFFSSAAMRVASAGSMWPAAGLPLSVVMK